jgi:L-rhamnose-H+ transport protein
MNAILGVLFHSLGGFAAGSFYMPYDKVKGWAWESYWIIGGIFSWLIIPPIAAWLTVPGFVEIIRTSAGSILTITYTMGVIWGIGGLTYGLGIRYLGMSLGNSVILGFTAAFGALVPAIYFNIFPESGKVSLTDMINSTGGRLVLLGVLLCILGIGVSGKAGVMKERQLSLEDKKASIVEFSLVKGLIIATFSGILSAFFNYGIEAGKPLAKAAIEAGFNPLYQNNITFVVLLWGGLTTNFIWTSFLNLKNESYRNYTDKTKSLFNNYSFAALAGTIWFLQFFFYGMGESKIGNGAASWILHMSSIILTANLWGFYRKEWRGVNPKALRTIISGVVIILLSVVIVGIGNSI